MSGPERRKSIRTQLLLKVEYQEPGDLLTDYLTDLAEGGLFIRTTVPFKIGQRIAFAVSFPGLLDPLRLAGIVRWRVAPKPDQPDEPVGVGVEFVFESEAHRRHVEQLVRGFKGPDMTANARSGGSEPFRVLLVEDNQFVHDLFRHAVRKFHREMHDMGHLEIVSAVHGQDAVEILRSSRIDLAIVDQFLPVMKGTELVAKMRGDPRSKDIPILMVSVGGNGVREEALACGVDLYLDKPVLLKQLLSTLRLLVGKREGLSQRAESAVDGSE